MPSFGRGGAGNIGAVQKETERAKDDIEANQPSAGNAGDDFVPPADIKRDEQQYAHSGRGGAGNFYSPKELNRHGKFSDAHRSHIPGDGTLAPTEGESAPPSYNAVPTGAEAARKTGRGGAGNYAIGINEAEARAARRRQEEDERQAKLKEDIEKGVQESLAVPPKAKVTGEELQ